MRSKNDGGGQRGSERVRGGHRSSEEVRGAIYKALLCHYGLYWDGSDGLIRTYSGEMVVSISPSIWIIIH